MTIFLGLLLAAVMLFVGAGFWACARSPSHLRRFLADATELQRLLQFLEPQKLHDEARKVKPVFGSYAGNIATHEAAHAASLSRTRNLLFLLAASDAGASYYLSVPLFWINVLIFALPALFDIPTSAKNNNATHVHTVMLNLIKWHSEDPSGFARYCASERSEFSVLHTVLIGCPEASSDAAEFVTLEGKTAEQKLARLEAENASLREHVNKRKLSSNIANEEDFDNDPEVVQDFVDQASEGESVKPVEQSVGLLNMVFWSDDAGYYLGQPLEEDAPLREFSPKEYAIFKNAGWVKAFQDEQVFYASDVEFVDQQWTLCVGTTKGRVYKLSVQYVANGEVEVAQVWNRSKQFLIQSLGAPSEQQHNPMRVNWDLTDGNAILESVTGGGQRVINLFLTAGTRGW
jgi:hypothetical protein